MLELESNKLEAPRSDLCCLMPETLHVVDLDERRLRDSDALKWMVWVKLFLTLSYVY